MTLTQSRRSEKNAILKQTVDHTLVIVDINQYKKTADARNSPASFDDTHAMTQLVQDMTCTKPTRREPPYN